MKISIKNARAHGQLGGQNAAAAKQIAEKITKLGGTTYIEPFIGRGSVYRAVNNRADFEKTIVNDKDCKRLKQAKEFVCQSEESKACELLKDSKKSCGKDWKEFLRHDSKDAVFYLDPPYEKVHKNDMSYRENDAPSLDSILERTKNLDGAVALSYKNTPEFRKKICGGKFKCFTIKKSLFKNEWTEILAIKKAGK